MSLPTEFKLTDIDAVYLALGTASQGFFQYFMIQKYPGAYPTTLQAAAISAAALTGGYIGMTTGKIPRPVAVYILGFGISQVISYLLPRLTGTPAPTGTPTPSG